MAKQICDSLTVPVDAEAITTACLLHDMANILKFNLASPLLNYLKPRDKDRLAEIKEEFKQKYGVDEHRASLSIAKELGVSKAVLNCMKSIDFAKALENVIRPEIEPKICDYADLRVGPFGVVSLDERLAEGRKRYKNRPEKWIQPEQW